MSKFIELPIINLEKYYSQESEYIDYMYINVDYIVKIYDWSGINDETINDNLITGIVLTTGEHLIVDIYYGNIIDMIYGKDNDIYTDKR